MVTMDWETRATLLSDTKAQDIDPVDQDTRRQHYIEGHAAHGRDEPFEAMRPRQWKIGWLLADEAEQVRNSDTYKALLSDAEESHKLYNHDDESDPDAVSADDDEPIEYVLEVYDRNEVDETQPFQAPIIRDWDITTDLYGGCEKVTTATKVTIKFGCELPDVTLHHADGFTKRDVVDAICRTLQKPKFEYTNDFLDRIVVDDDLIAFHLTQGAPMQHTSRQPNVDLILTLDQTTKVRRSYHAGLLPSSAIARFERIPGWQWGAPGAPIEYSVELAAGGCPTISDWDENTELQFGDEIIATGRQVAIKLGDGLPNVTLDSDDGFSFTRRDIVNAICMTLQAANFIHDHRYLEIIAVDGDWITFHLGS
jgi:hypothetical protein